MFDPSQTEKNKRWGPGHNKALNSSENLRIHYLVHSHLEWGGAELRNQQRVEGIWGCAGWWCIMHKMWITLTWENGGLFCSPIVGLGELGYSPGLCMLGCPQNSGFPSGTVIGRLLAACVCCWLQQLPSAFDRVERYSSIWVKIWLRNPIPWKGQLVRWGLWFGFPRDICTV